MKNKIPLNTKLEIISLVYLYFFITPIVTIIEDIGIFVFSNYSEKLYLTLAMQINDFSCLYNF